MADAQHKLTLHKVYCDVINTQYIKFKCMKSSEIYIYLLKDAPRISFSCAKARWRLAVIFYATRQRSSLRRFFSQCLLALFWYLWHKKNHKNYLGWVWDDPKNFALVRRRNNFAIIQIEWLCVGQCILYIWQQVQRCKFIAKISTT